MWLNINRQIKIETAFKKCITDISVGIVAQSELTSCGHLWIICCSFLFKFVWWVICVWCADKSRIYWMGRDFLLYPLWVAAVVVSRVIVCSTSVKGSLSGTTLFSTLVAWSVQSFSRSGGRCYSFIAHYNNSYIPSTWGKNNFSIFYEKQSMFTLCGSEKK